MVSCNGNWDNNFKMCPFISHKDGKKTCIVSSLFVILPVVPRYYYCYYYWYKHFETTRGNVDSSRPAVTDHLSLNSGYKLQPRMTA